MGRAEYLAFATLNRKLNQIIEILGGQVMPALDELEIEVDRAVAAIESAKAKIDELIANGSISQGQVTAMAAKLRAATDSLSPPV